jgi:hypothetical protein
MPDNPLEHCVSSMGKTRDLDGSVDRVPDPPEKIWQLLYVLQRKCEDENINVESIFGARRYSTALLPQAHGIGPRSRGAREMRRRAARRRAHFCSQRRLVATTTALSAAANSKPLSSITFLASRSRSERWSSSGITIVWGTRYGMTLWSALHPLLPMQSVDSGRSRTACCACLACCQLSRA